MPRSKTFYRVEIEHFFFFFQILILNLLVKNHKQLEKSCGGEWESKRLRTNVLNATNEFMHLINTMNIMKIG